MVLPSVNDPNVLVLQGVKKAARGNYSCRVGNGIPTHDFEVQSEPIFLDVKCKWKWPSYLFISVKNSENVSSMDLNFNGNVFTKNTMHISSFL